MVSKKKGHGKRKSTKVSLTKLSNKKLNKLSKQGKLKRKLPKAKLLQLIRERTNPNQERLLEEQDEVQKREQSDIPLVEADYDYFATPGRDFSFLSDVAETPKDDKSKRGRKRQNQSKENLEESFEKKARQRMGYDKQVKALLPIKSRERGVVPQTMELEEDPEEEEEDEGEEEEPVPKKKPLPMLSLAQIVLQRRQKLAEKKHRIATLSSGIMENPEENLKKLRELRLMLEESDPDLYVTVRKLVMLSLMEVFKDIIPGYQIRQASEKEKQQSAKKETKQLRLFEENLLSNYRHYLEFLEQMTTGKSHGKHNKDRRKEKKLNGMNLPVEAVTGLREVSLHCFCEILATHTHFNYRTNIISVVVPFMADKNHQISDTVCQSIRSVFKEDKTGEVTLEITRLIGRLIKARNFDIDPKVLNTFLSLKINEVDNLHKRDKKAPKKKSEDMSRHERKRKKQMLELERELEDAAFMVDKKKKLKLHTHIINMVFLTYFRILKKAQYSPLLSAVLEGLAKFAHLININFFDDLFAVLNDLVNSGNLTYRESLHCVKTAFIILSGQGSALNIDPLRFYRHLYTGLMYLHAGHSSADTPTALECMDIMISKRRRQVSHQRFLAFAKRVTTLALQQQSHGALGMLATTRHLLHAYPKTDVLLDPDSQGSGMYLPELDEPEHCNAHSTAFYELHTLRRHYHPTVRQYANHLLHGAPSQGVGQLMTQLSRKSPTALFEEYDPSEMNFNPSIDTRRKTTKKKPRTYPDVLQPEIQESTKQALMSVQGIKLSSLDFLLPASEATVDSVVDSDGLSSKLARDKKAVKGRKAFKARKSPKDLTSHGVERIKPNGSQKQTSVVRKKKAH